MFMNVCASGTTVYTETIREICCGINISNDGIIQEAESQIGRLTSCLFYQSSLLALVKTSQESSLKNCGVVGYSVIFGGCTKTFT